MKRVNAGFTLIEIMLVVVLLAMSAVAVVMTLPDTQQNASKEHAYRFYYKLQLLNEDAILNGRDYGIRIEEKNNQYSFMQLTKKGWQPLESKTYKETKFDEGVELRFQIGSDAWQNNDKLFNQDSLFDHEMFADLDDKDKVLPPQVFVLSSGEVTPFYLDVLPSSERQNQWQIRAKENGEIVLLSPEKIAAEEP